jgi:ricin-type beta-trefoil lectin protein
VTNRDSGKVMDVVSASTANNAGNKQLAWNGGGNQKWQFQDTGSGCFRIVNQNSGRCLDVASSSTADGADVIQYTCGSGSSGAAPRSEPDHRAPTSLFASSQHPAQF